MAVGFFSVTLHAREALKYSTYLGGSSNDYGHGIVVDTEGCTYIVGQSASSDFPVTNAWQSSLQGSQDAIVTKISADGSTILFSTYLGGSGDDRGMSVAIDSAGDLYICGSTDSTDFPTVNAYQTNRNGYWTDYFVSKLSGSGTNLIYSTYLGGSFFDYGFDVAVDTAGCAYVVGKSYSTDFPTMNPFQATNGCSSGYNFTLTKLSADGSNLIYSTYLGGSGAGHDYPRVAVNANGEAYFSGATSSTDYPVTNAYQSAFAGPSNSWDAVLTKFSASGTSLVYSTYLGGSEDIDQALNLVIDSDGGAILCGLTQSDNFPITNAYQATLHGPGDIFVTQFSPSGTSLVFSTYIGGYSYERAYGLTVATDKSVYVVGMTHSSNFPVTNAPQSASGGVDDGIVLQLSSNRTSLVFSTYLGGNANDSCYGVDMDAQGHAHVVGYTGSTNFPVKNAYQAARAGGKDAFVAELFIPHPSVVVTTEMQTVFGAVTEFTVCGTNYDVDGTMWWTNALNGASGTLVASNEWRALDIPLALGDNLITVSGSYDGGDEDSDSVVITRVREYGPGSPNHYVATNGANVWPYTNWADAAVMIQDALDTASDNDAVWVSNGVYDVGGAVQSGYSLTNRVMIARAISVWGVGGPENTFIVGAADPITTNGPAAVRCVYMTSNAWLSGFTLTNGHTLTTGDQNTERGAGGVLLDYGGTVSNCVIAGNQCHGRGAGANCHHGGTIIDSVLRDNHSADDAGGALIEDGQITGCRVFNNTADSDDGGGIFFYAGGRARNCLIIGNSANDCGGGVMFDGSASNALLESCTVVSNNASNGGGIRTWGGTVRNCIVYDNTATNSADNWSLGGNSPSFEYTCTTPTNSIPGGEGCITNRPQFADASNGNYRLSSGSLCKDAGTNQTWMIGATDLDGAPRILDAVVDMGAYEYVSVQYVATNGAHIFPFASWADAATNIQAAVDAANPGATVLVSNGTYIINDDIDITNDLTVRAVSDDPSLTVINPNDADRAFELGDFNIMIAGFTITNGNLIWSAYGGGIYAHSTTPVVSNCVISGCYAGRGGAVWKGTLWHCRLTGNESIGLGGGAYQSVLNFCEVSGNESDRGGGIAETTANNCYIEDNQVPNWGGGVYLGTVNNSQISGNRAGLGGGAYDATLNNCSVTRNHAGNMGGGTRNGTVNNSIVYYNTTDGEDPNRYGGTYNYCCTTADATNGIGNIATEPLMLSPSHIMTNSPCIGAGTNAYTSGRDIDGAAWRDPPSIGCDEPHARGLAGPLSVAISADQTYAYINYPLSFCADIDGKLSSNRWAFGDGASTDNLYITTHSWNALGDYTVTLTAFNIDYPAGVSTSILISVITNLHYVAAGSTNAVSPYTTWGTAASNIQDAVDAALDEGIVLVTNGFYLLDRSVDIYKDLTVESVNGSAYTIVDGDADNRCFILGDYNILLEGLTITNGYYDDDGGGIKCWSTKPTISNCCIVGNANEDDYDGGGVYMGTLYNCTIRNNHSTDNGGGLSGSIAYNCLISGNSSDDNGGGADAGTLYNCTIVDNQAADDGGGVYYSALTNCIVWGNMATSGTNWSNGSISYSCTTPDPGAGSGNITNNPQFVDAANGNYRLLYGSPCIDTGTNLPFLTNDLDGTTRPLDGNYDGTNAWDMGCYEYNPATADSNGDGVPDWWYHGYELNPTNPIMATIDSDGDGLDDGSEYTADTIPTDSNSYFRVTDMEKNSPVSLSFDSSTNCLYIMDGCTNLIDGAWTDVPGAGPRSGAGGADFMQDTNEPTKGPFYRMKVERP